MKPKVSIIVPVYNSQFTICNCLTSIISQSFFDYELVIIDDGSTDESVEICRQFVIRNQNIVLYSMEHKGVQFARYYGLTHCKGNYILFVDSDDRIDYEYISNLFNAIENSKSDIVCSNFIIETENGQRIIEESHKGTVDREYIEKVILSKYLYDDDKGKWAVNHSLSGKIYRKDLLLNAFCKAGLNLLYNEDGLVNCYVWSIIRQASFLDYAGYYYVQRKDSTSHIPNTKIGIQLIHYLLSKYKQILRLYVSESEIKRQFYLQFGDSILWHILMDYGLTATYKTQISTDCIPLSCKCCVVIDQNLSHKYVEKIKKDTHIKDYICFIEKKTFIENFNLKRNDKDVVYYVVSLDYKKEHEIVGAILETGVEHERIWALPHNSVLEIYEIGEKNDSTMLS